MSAWLDDDAAPAHGLRCDLVLEGGGVKGIGLVGAALTLAETGYRFVRIAGTSAGAVVGALLAALQKAGESVEVADEIAKTLDYSRFRDRGFPGRWLGPLAFVADAFSLVFESGIYEGDYLHDWMRGVLSDLGVVTFADLRRVDAGSSLPVELDYGLVVTASDLSRKRLVLLPWDYADYGLVPDEQRVADAVRASASIPFFFEPVTMRARDGASTLVDGGLLSNYPIGIFDRTDGSPPRWPTIGTRLTSRQSERPPARPVEGTVSLALALVETAIEGCQAQHIADPCNVARSIFVDTTDVAATDFGITEQQKLQLLHAGRAAATKFLAGWDFQRWLARCRTTVDEPAGAVP